MLQAPDLSDNAAIESFAMAAAQFEVEPDSVTEPGSSVAAAGTSAASP